jgi:hypothetical protein
MNRARADKLPLLKAPMIDARQAPPRAAWRRAASEAEHFIND